MMLLLLLLGYNEMISSLMHATVATPPCWGDTARLLSLLSHASSVSLVAVLSAAFSHPNVDSSIAAAAVLILSCSSLSFALSSLAACTDAQL